MDQKKKALIGLHISVFLMGASGLFGKLVTTSAFFLVFGRVMFASAALLLFLRYKREKIKPNCSKDAFSFLMLGILMAFHWYAFFYAIQLSTVSIGLLTFSTFTVFTTLLEPVLFRTRLTIRDLAVAALCCAGVWLIVPDTHLSGLSGENTLWGVIWGVLSGLSYALMLLLNKKYSTQYSPVTLTFYQCLVAMLVLLPVILWMREPVLALDWVYLFIHGVVCTAVAFTLYVSATRYIRAQTISILTMLELLYGVALAYLILDESLNMNMALGGGIILIASYAAMRKPD
ncbi:MAG: DMT family transporter [Alphaproteobacteria bacterium]